MDALEVDATLNSLRNITIGGLGVDLRGRVEETDDVGGSTLGGGNLGDEGEDIAGLDGREDGGDSGGRQPGRSQTRRQGQ